MPFTPGPHRTRDGTAATVTSVTSGIYPIKGLVGDERHTWTASGRVLDTMTTPLDLLYRDEPGEDHNNHSKETAMSIHENTDWDYEMLQIAIDELDTIIAAEFRKTPGGTPFAEALRHARDFIEYNREEGEILSPLQNYIINK